MLHKSHVTIFFHRLCHTPFSRRGMSSKQRSRVGCCACFSNPSRSRDCMLPSALSCSILQWRALLESKSPIVLPVDTSQMPDVFVHLLRVTRYFLSRLGSNKSSWGLRWKSGILCLFVPSQRVENVECFFSIHHFSSPYSINPYIIHVHLVAFQ